MTQWQQTLILFQLILEMENKNGIILVQAPVAITLL